MSQSKQKLIQQVKKPSVCSEVFLILVTLSHNLTNLVVNTSLQYQGIGMQVLR